MAMKSGVSGSIRRKIFRRDEYTCQACGLVGFEVNCGGGCFTHHTEKEGIYLSIDHIFPRSKGGGHEEPNLRTLCTRCNTIKGVHNVT